MIQLTTIELVIFDLAGTTVKHNNEVHNSFIDAFKDEGILISYKDANEAMGKPKPVAISEILIVHGIEDLESVTKIHDNFQDKIIKHYMESDEVEEKPGASDIFKWLKSHDIKVGLDTGFDRLTTDALIKKLGWVDLGLVDYSVTSDEVSKGRPHPDMIFKCMKLAGVMDARKVVKVGDTPVDLQEGARAGVGLNVGVTTGAFRKQELQEYPHDALIEDLMQLAKIIYS